TKVPLAPNRPPPSSTIGAGMSPWAQSNSRCVESATVIVTCAPPQVPISARDGVVTLAHADPIESAAMSAHRDHREGIHDYQPSGREPPIFDSTAAYMSALIN